MAEEHGNGDGNGRDPTLAALGDVVAELRGLRADTNARFDAVEQVLRGQGRQLGEVGRQLGGVGQQLGEVVTGLADLRGEVHAGFAGLGQKIESAAARDRRLEEGLQRLGERVARLEGREPEPR